MGKWRHGLSFTERERKLAMVVGMITFAFGAGTGYLTVLAKKENFSHFTTFSLGLLIGIGAVMVMELSGRRVKETKRGDLENIIRKGFQAMAEHLPNVSKISATCDAGANWILQVVCPQCGKRNRLVAGIEKAGCGHCHEKFSTPSKLDKDRDVERLVN